MRPKGDLSIAARSSTNCTRAAASPLVSKALTTLKAAIATVTDCVITFHAADAWMLAQMSAVFARQPAASMASHATLTLVSAMLAAI